jgi:hypothetical protein
MDLMFLIGLAKSPYRAKKAKSGMYHAWLLGSEFI